MPHIATALETAACLATMVFIALALVFFIAFDTILSIAHTVWANRAAKRRPPLYRPHAPRVRGWG